MDRRSFLLTTAAASAAAPATPAFELHEATVDSLGAGMRSGKYTAASIASLYLKRIAEVDKAGPRINAVIETNPDALRIAAALDQERRAGRIRGPLHGIPVLIKDNIDTADRMKTTAGSLALVEARPQRDAHIVERLRAAGAVILGKTNLSEWANFRSTHSTSGWSGRGGQTRNPYALDRNPSGSSSGTGAGIAANLCALGVGTETDGSITSPASIHGLVGLKPTVGLISRSGIIPISHTQDTAGPMTRTVRDTALLLGALAGVDPNDPPTREAEAWLERDYTRFLDPKGLQGARLGIARKFFESNPVMNRLLDSLVADLGKLGAVIVDPADLPTHNQMKAPEGDVLAYEFKAGVNRYFESLAPGAPVRSLAQLIAFNQRNRDREMPHFEQEILIDCEARGPLTDKTYLEARSACRRLTRDEGIDAVLAKHRLDAIVTLTSGPAWLTDWINGDRDTGDCTTPAAVAGYPHITVPAAMHHGLPIGLSFFGAAWSEPALLKFAYAFEQAVHARRAPAFAAHAQA